ncbi:MAG: recombination-associated protein RdgC [Deltaproteobacteria bacterium]|jgi:DNA recombination-dependent growth factor C|nr:recombination-associated protein RdgC [Deltaproteobacteria bacterium]
MGFIKGMASMSRYRLIEEPEGGLTDEFVQRRLEENAFVDIEETSEESSLGWVQIFDQLSSAFPQEDWRFGEVLAFSLRLDERKLPARTLSRYCAIGEARFAAQTGHKPNSVKKKEIKDALRQDLMRRSLLDTKLLEVVWLAETNEVWLGATGEKDRALFEEAWARTFGLGLRLLVPVTIGQEILKKPLLGQLMALRNPSSFGESE